MQEDSKKYHYWVILSIIAILGLIISSLIMTRGILAFKSSRKTIEVVGSAKKQIRSDLVYWRGSYSARAPKMQDAYATMKQNAERVRKYLIAKGLKEKEMVFSSITATANYVILKNGQQTSQIDSYKLTQNIEIRSSDVDKITDISRKATELINEGVEFQSDNPQYYYTRIADLKIEVLSYAAKDAKLRAEKIALHTGSEIGRLSSASMGVFQITPLYSTEVSDLGLYDTTAIDKEITAVVICSFEIK
jgi:uncharacterized protein